MNPARNEGSPRLAVLAVVAVGMLVFAGLAVILLLDEKPRAVEPASRSLNAALVMPPFSRACLPEVRVPARAGRVELVVSTAGKPGPPLLVEVEEGGRTVTSGRHPGRYVDTPLSIPLGREVRTTADARVCVANRGDLEIALLGAPLRRQDSTLGWIDEGGAPTGPPASVTSAGRRLPRQPQRIRFEWQFRDEVSPLSLVGVVRERFGLAKATFFGSGTMWIALAMTLIASLVALAVVMRGVWRS